MADVTLTIDGQSVTVPKGTLIVEAAKKIGIEIPVFCYHGKLESVGMCRMCLVEVGTPARDRSTGEYQLDEEGQPVIRFNPKPMTACTTPVSDGMVVKVDSDKALAARKAILEFLLTSHPLDCPVCDKGGECPLQDLTLAHGPGVSRFDYEDKQHFPKKYPLGDLIMLDMERCILCARCTRFQAEIAHDPVLAIEERGRYAHIVSYSNPSFDSHYSGNTTDICPVGALTSRDFRFRARAWELTNIPSLCNHCGVGCNTILGVRTGDIRRIMPRQNEPVNEVWICDKGRFVHHFNGSPNRLTRPMIRRDGELVEVEWEQALDRAAEGIKKIIKADGPRAMGGIAGARLSNEDLYLFQKLFREVIGSHNVDHRLGLSAAIQDEIAYTVGVGVGTDLGRAGQGTAILVIGADLDEEAPILYLRIAAAARKRGAHLINAGSRHTKLDGQAGTVLRYRPGAAAHLVWGMLASALEQGLIERSALEERADGLADLEAALADYSPADVAEITGLPAGAIEAAAKRFAEADNGLILFGLEVGSDPSLQAAIEALALATGHAGRPDNGVIPILPYANSRGAADMGLLPDRLPGYKPLAADEKPGLSAAEMLAEEPPVKGLLLAGVDPVAEGEPYRTALEKLDFLIVQELFMTETAKLADVVFPARAVAERDGTFTNLERRVQAYDPGLPAPGHAWADWLILSALTARLGTDWSYASADGVMAEITRQVPIYTHMAFENLLAPISVARQTAHYIYQGMSYTADVREGLQWPSLAEGEARLPLRFIAPVDPPAGDLLLLAPRVLYDGGRLLAETEILQNRLHQPRLRLSPADANRLGVMDEEIAVISRNGREVRLPVQVDERLEAGLALLPRHLSGRPAEQLLGPDELYAAITVEKS